MLSAVIGHAKTVWKELTVQEDTMSISCRSAFTLVLTGRILASGGLAIAVILAAPTAAQAARPDTGTFSSTDTYVDAEVCASDGFSVDVTQVDAGRFQVFLDSDGNFVRALVHNDYTATISANGHTLLERDRWQTYFYPDGSSREVGATVHIQGPGIVQLDAGQIAFDPNGSVAYVHGPHPQALGQTFCSALVP